MPVYAMQLLTALIIVGITALSGKSTGLVLKLQIPIMAVVGLSILALILGVFGSELRTPELTATYRTAPQGFWYVFAVFFPAVTGFTAGIGLSGDLKNPQKSIPRGTLLAVITGSIIYLLILVLLAISSRIGFEELAGPEIAWTKVAVLGAWLVFPGIWGAILSSAFGSVLGGPRVLQALASDGLAPRFLARLSKTGQPTIATWTSGFIALAAVLLGELNAVAQFVTILFLTLYVTINLSAALEKLVGDPSFRPTINEPWYVSLFGSIGAIVVMFLINPIACVVAIGLELLLYGFLNQRALKKQWGDVWAGFWLALTRFALLQLRCHERDPRNWRPMDQAIEEDGLVAFSEINVVREFENGVIDVTQANGIAGLHSNTVMFGWPKKRDRLEAMLRIMATVSKLGKSTIIARLKWAHEPGQKKQIDIWWRGKQTNGDLMVLLAHLLNLNPEWSDARIVVRSIVESEAERERMAESLSALIPESRIQADTEVIVKSPDQSVAEIMHRYSGKTAVVFLGLMEPEPGAEAQYANQLVELADGLNTIIFVRNAGEFAGELI
jgi:amino acid transporter